METYTYTVEVQAETLEQADRVMVERIEHDEELGFNYKIDWERPVETHEIAKAALEFLDEKLADDPEWVKARNMETETYTCRYCKDTIVRQEETEKWVDANALESCAPHADRHAPIGCPACGRTDEIEASVTCMADVPVTWGEPHADDTRWGVPENIDIDEATSAECRACGWTAIFDGGSDKLYDLLGLER